MDEKKKKLIGITGIIASGKTTVTDMFVAKGAKRIDADAIAHEILAGDDEVKKRLVDLFGRKILTGGSVDREKLRSEVFGRSEKVKKLCDIIHPGIIEKIKEKADSFDAAVVVIDAPLLIEAGLHEYVDIVVVVHAEEDIITERALKRGLSGSEVRDIIAEQIPFSEKVKFADFVIYNNTDIDVIKKGVERIWQKL